MFAINNVWQPHWQYRWHIEFPPRKDEWYSGVHTQANQQATQHYKPEQRKTFDQSTTSEVEIMGFFNNLSSLLSAVATIKPITPPAAGPTPIAVNNHPIFTPTLAVHTLGCNVQYATAKPASVNYANTTSTTTVLTGTVTNIPIITGTVISTITNYVTITTTKASGTYFGTSTVTTTPVVPTTKRIFGACGPKPAGMKRDLGDAAENLEKRELATFTATQEVQAFVVAATCSYEATLFLPATTVTSASIITPLTTTTATITKEAVTPAKSLIITFTHTAPASTITHCAQCRGLAKQGCPTADLIW
ncbi:Hypothetical protein D9617_3g019880 [Elsinoe fawcettii]|nr:Hypothetical protein D9617_3g019880 [Elsinoe fawcettii]